MVSSPSPEDFDREKQSHRLGKLWLRNKKQRTGLLSSILGKKVFSFSKSLMILMARLCLEAQKPGCSYTAARKSWTYQGLVPGQHKPIQIVLCWLVAPS